MSVHSFVAHFLKEHGYHETLRTFEAEYGKAISTDLPHAEALDDIIADRMKYLSTDTKPVHDRLLDPALKEIKSGQIKEWSAPYPQKSDDFVLVSELVVDSAVIEVEGKKFILLGTSKMSLVVADFETGEKVLTLKNVIGRIVIRKVVVASQYVLLCGMNGKIYMGEFSENMLQFTIIAEEQIHPRLVADLKVVKWKDSYHLVSLGWDLMVKVFEVSPAGLALKGEPYKLSNQGCCMDVCVYQEKLVVLVGKNEITLLDVLCMEHETLELVFKIALNDAEFSASGFTPRCVRIFNEGGVPLVAVGTSHEPYMRVVLVSLKELGTEGSNIRRDQIITNINTLSPQDKYSQAQIEWRHDGSGLWVIGEDGDVRGLDLEKEEIVLDLKKHDGRIKAVVVEDDVLVTCGVDRRVVKWT